MKVIFFLVTAIGFMSNALAQNFYSISGKIIDVKTKETLPGAIVFLANTAIGVSANETGTFMLTKISPGKYDLTVSMVGYASYVRSILFPGNTSEGLVISLEPALVQLDAVTVEARREKQNRHYYAEFETRFLGATENSRKCKILNSFDVFVYKDGDKIIALASKPIIVENKALGYKIYYELKEFEVRKIIDDFSMSMSGIPRFEELIPESEKQRQKWVKARDRAYFGSISHFLISLRANELTANYFEIRGAGGNLLTKQEIVRDSSIRYDGIIRVTFEGEIAENGYSRNMSYQNSELKFSGDPITIYRNGYFEDYRNLTFQGYMGWSTNIAEMVPFGYQPSHLLKK
jgi:hypothetical protein